MPCDMAKPCHLPRLNRSEDRFLSSYETFDLVPYIVLDFVLSDGDAGELSKEFVLERLDPFSCVSQESQRGGG